MEKYDSNTLSESNFLTDDSGIKAGSLLYYRLALCAWDQEKDIAHNHASSAIFIPLDAGYGDPALPAELFWIQKEKNISGKEILEILKQIFYVLQPKAIYLNDRSHTATTYSLNIDIRIMRALTCGRTFYGEYAGFEVVDCKDYKSHEGENITQSRKIYNRELEHIRNYPLSNLLKIIKNGNDKEDIVELIEDLELKQA